MKLLDNIYKCTGCGACVSVCSAKCITLEINHNGFWYPEIDDNKCLNCGACVKTCHINEEHKDIREVSDFYACWDTNEVERKKGSSGAFFGVVANYVINKGGCVFGAYINHEDFSLSHVSSDDVGVDALKGSKYYESSMKQVVDRMRDELEKDRWVLFCGTPCQVMGIRSIFKYRYPKLVLVDFFCHGVTSAKSFQKYINDLQIKYGKKASHVSFRSKLYGWKTYCMVIDFDDGKKYIKLKDEDPYYNFFFSDKCLRQSCYECNRVINSEADITMGDFWGVYTKSNITDTDDGISLVVAHSDLGKSLFACLKKHLKVYNLTFDEAEYAYTKRKKDYNSGFRIDDYDFFDRKNIRKLTVKQILKNFVTKRRILRNILYGKWGYLWNKHLIKREK